MLSYTRLDFSMCLQYNRSIVLRLIPSANKWGFFVPDLLPYPDGFP